MGPDIRVVGVGGGGCNAVSRMMEVGIAGVEFIALDTDAYKLRECQAGHKLAIGQALTGGLGTGGDVGLGRQAAEQSQKEIQGALEGADMVFVTAAMGGGTGSGAASVVASLAKSLGALTVGVATTPFHLERQRRMRTALQGIAALRGQVDAIIVIHNQRLLSLVDRRTSIIEAFTLADDVLRQAVQGVAELVTVPGLINVDFADVRAVLEDAGPALMGSAAGPSDRPAVELVEAAVASPLLDNGIVGATEILLNVTFGPDTTLHQVNHIADEVAKATGTSMPNVVFGAVSDPQMHGQVKITIIATGFREGTQPYYAEGRGMAERAREQRPAPSPEVETQPLLVPQFEAEVVPGDLDMPTFLRRGLQPASGEPAAEEKPPEHEAVPSEET
ncbi:MAG TPA: cell division protein FtsZ [Armatimonadetes bacterium]|nr:cell division protein FtsZ [Armatimonadota bacterium]